MSSVGDSALSALILIVAAFVIIAVAAIFQIRNMTAKDTELPEAVARLHQQGYQVIAKIPRAPNFPFSEFKNNPFGETAVHITAPGSADTAFRFSYVYETNNGTATVRLGCAVVPVPFVSPGITIRYGSRSILSSVLGKRVTTDSEPFNAYYEVESYDERFAYTLLGYELIDWFLNEPALSSGLTVKIEQNWMLLYSHNVEYDALPGILTMAQTARALIPSVVASMYPLRQ